MSTETKTDIILRKQAWDYFAIHASQRMSIFNFYIALSSVTLTIYATSWKQDSNLQPARGFLAFLLCLFAFTFWKLDQRNRGLIKNAERALMHFEALDSADQIVKVFSEENSQTARERAKFRGSHKLYVWNWVMSYSDCFNLVFGIFALIGVAGIAEVFAHHFRLIR